jgi:hypothetical protein
VSAKNVKRQGHAKAEHPPTPGPGSPDPGPDEQLVSYATPGKGLSPYLGSPTIQGVLGGAEASVAASRNRRHQVKPHVVVEMVEIDGRIHRVDVSLRVATCKEGALGGLDKGEHVDIVDVFPRQTRVGARAGDDDPRRGSTYDWDALHVEDQREVEAPLGRSLVGRLGVLVALLRGRLLVEPPALGVARGGLVMQCLKCGARLRLTGSRCRHIRRARHGTVFVEVYPPKNTPPLCAYARSVKPTRE